MLNSNDQIFASIRDCTLTEVSKEMHRLAVETNCQVQEFRSSEQTLKQLKQFISNNLGKITTSQQALSLHLHLSAKISDAMKNTALSDVFRLEDDMLTRDKELSFEKIEKKIPIFKLLRLITLFSIINDGITEVQFNGFVSFIVKVCFQIQKTLLFFLFSARNTMKIQSTSLRYKISRNSGL